ncbi:MAG TPA: hypothetical protein PKN33_18725 [Phycisphaerae bacterium]|nr:hypothetical protein [Phycisphaerae bacterium]
MPYDDPDPTDPMTLHGVGVETDDENATIEMAQCFIEEYIRMGFTADCLLKIFTNPGYAGPHLAYEQLGEEGIRNLIQDEMRIRNIPTAERESLVRVGASGAMTLRVLE